MTKDKHKFRVALAGLILLVVLASFTAYLSTWKKPVDKQAVTIQEQAPEVSGQILIYVNNRLAYRGPVHSFLKPTIPMLALGLFPTSGFQSASVSFYNEKPTTWSAYAAGGSMASTYYKSAASSCADCGCSVWGMVWSIAPLLLIYDTKGNKWTEISLSTTPSVYSNATGVLLSISGSVTPSLTTATNVSMIRLVRPTFSTCYTNAVSYAVRLAEDTISPAVTVNPNDTLTVVYQFYFKSNQVFTENWARAFFVWLYNVPGAKVSVTATDGTTVTIDPSAPSCSSHANNAPVNTYIVIGNGQALFNRTAYKVVSEVARAEPSVQVYTGGVSLSYTFTFSKDTTITELAVYSKLRGDKEVMLFYYILPQPVTAKAGIPFTVTFYINLPYQDRV